MHFSSKKVLFVLSATFIFVLNLLNSCPTANAQEFSSTKINAEQKLCHHQFFRLNGNEAPTFTCLDSSTSGDLKPNISTVDCPGQVELSVPSDEDYVCFSGRGFINLRDVFMPCGWHYWTCGTPWEGRATNYQLSGCASNAGSISDPIYPGYFAFDRDGNGDRWYFQYISNEGQFNYPGRGVHVGPYSLLIDC